ncbi:MAG: glycosyltransferase family 39 protein [Pirellulales bacterium]
MSREVAAVETSSLVAYWREVRTWSVVALLLLAHFMLANAAAWHKGGMFDEPSHIASGNAAWRTGDFRIIPLAIFQQRWMTLPLEWTHARAPSTDQQIWRRGDNWGYGRQLIYDLGNNSQDVLRNCRMMNSLAGVVLGALVFAWSRRLFGTVGAFVSLLLYCFNPTVLAHAAAATPDTFSALAFTAAPLSLLAVLRKVTPLRLLGSGLVWGLALVSKFSTLLLLPIAALMLLVRLWEGGPLAVRLRPSSTTEVIGRGRQSAYFVARCGRACRRRSGRHLGDVRLSLRDAARRPGRTAAALSGLVRSHGPRCRQVRAVHSRDRGHAALTRSLSLLLR